MRLVSGTSTHLRTLDGWRAVAILMVLAAHQHYPNAALQNLAPYGAVGVHLFFALSGLLITHRLIEENRLTGGISWSQFYRRRTLRILPAAMLYLAVMALVTSPTPRQMLASLFFFRNYIEIPTAEGWYTGHFWSLAVEEHFYLLWPALIVVFGLRRAPVLAPALALLVVLWRAVNPTSGNAIYHTDFRLDGLFWGCCAAFLWSRYQHILTRLARPWHLPALIAAIITLLRFPFPGSIAVFSFLMAAVPLTTMARPLSLLEYQPIVWIGRVSYGIYLWQQLFMPPQNLPHPLGPLQLFPWNVMATFVVAACSYYFLERPLLDWYRAARTAPSCYSSGHV